MSSDHAALAEISQTVRGFVRITEDVARDAGLEPQQYQLLLSIKAMPRGERTTILGISRSLDIRHHTAVELVDRAEARGLVARRRDEVDRRLVVVELTREGDDAVKRAARYHLRRLRAEAPGLVRTLDDLLSDVGDGRRATHRKVS